MLEMRPFHGSSKTVNSIKKGSRKERKNEIQTEKKKLREDVNVVGQYENESDLNRNESGWVNE